MTVIMLLVIRMGRCTSFYSIHNFRAGSVLFTFVVNSNRKLNYLDKEVYKCVVFMLKRFFSFSSC
jgi:hypothetical protein